MSEARVLDDPGTVPSDTFVYRRIRPAWYVPDKGGGYRASSGAFNDMGGSMSVALGVVLEEMHLGPDAVIEAYPQVGLVRLRVIDIRSLGLGVVVEPTDAEPWHGAVYGKKTQGIRNQLVQASEWVQRPTLPTDS